VPPQHAQQQVVGLRRARVRGWRLVIVLHVEAAAPPADKELESEFIRPAH